MGNVTDFTKYKRKKAAQHDPWSAHPQDLPDNACIEDPVQQAIDQAVDQAIEEGATDITVHVEYVDKTPLPRQPVFGFWEFLVWGAIIAFFLL
jgi:hypothetical protein